MNKVRKLKKSNFENFISRFERKNRLLLNWVTSLALLYFLYLASEEIPFAKIICNITICFTLINSILFHLVASYHFLSKKFKFPGKIDLVATILYMIIAITLALFNSWFSTAIALVIICLFSYLNYYRYAWVWQNVHMIKRIRKKTRLLANY